MLLPAPPFPMASHDTHPAVGVRPLTVPIWT